MTDHERALTFAEKKKQHQDEKLFDIFILMFHASASYSYKGE